jgi:Cyclin-dependent kinase regulatory subunit
VFAMASRIEYSEKYQDDSFEYRYATSAACMPTCSLHYGSVCKLAFNVFHACDACHRTLSVCFRHVILPKELARNIPKSRCMTEAEWRGIGVQQSRGWTHYAIHRYSRT